MLCYREIHLCETCKNWRIAKIELKHAKTTQPCWRFSFLGLSRLVLLCVSFTFCFILLHHFVASLFRTRTTDGTVHTHTHGLAQAQVLELICEWIPLFIFSSNGNGIVGEEEEVWRRRSVMYNMPPSSSSTTTTTLSTLPKPMVLHIWSFFGFSHYIFLSFSFQLYVVCVDAFNGLSVGRCVTAVGVAAKQERQR